MLEKLKEGLQSAIRRILGASSIDEQVVKEFIKDLQRALLQADVNVKLVFDLTSRIEKRAINETPPPGLPRKDHVIKILYEELSNIMGIERKVELPADRLNTILMVGIQGSGKTSAAAKLARFMQKKGYKVGVVCADTFRPGALTQLRMLCSSVGIEVFGDENIKDPVRLAMDGVEYFKKRERNLVIIDTAGRHKEEKGLLEEMKAISDKIRPTLTLLVVDATIGQQCYNQSKAFHETTPVGGIIVTKLDGAAKGGGALAAAAATGAQILFISTGERIDDLEAFSPTRFVGRLLGLGDLKALLERARELEAEADKEKLKRIVSGKMTINDLYYQLEQVKKMGSLRKILDLIPGFSSIVGDKDLDLDEVEKKMNRWKAIIQSMTKEERENPEIITGSRIKRIARGSGTQEKDVKELLIKYKQTKALIKASKGHALRQLMKRFSSHELGE
ncbi:MAG: signal recognition particle receptor subunit alpha [Nitrososphaerota archaeon]|nr:signal recognition particle receptor subunit alpha [Nitrososphaerota archaeon]